MNSLSAYLNKSVTLFCANYIYTGTLTSFDEYSITLDNAHIVYETGELTAPKFKDAQPLGGPWNIVRSAVESFGPGK